MKLFIGHELGHEFLAVHEVAVHGICGNLGDLLIGKLNKGVAPGAGGFHGATEADAQHGPELGKVSGDFALVKAVRNVSEIHDAGLGIQIFVRELAVFAELTDFPAHSTRFLLLDDAELEFVEVVSGGGFRGVCGGWFGTGLGGR